MDVLKSSIFRNKDERKTVDLIDYFDAMQWYPISDNLTSIGISGTETIKN
jgi:hypothetical protein